MSYWLDVSKSLIGTAIGSALGLGSALVVWKIQRNTIDLASGNLAVITLGQYVKAVRNVSRGVREEQEEILAIVPGAPPWMTVRPIRAGLKEDLTIDLTQLAFLSDKPQLLEKLAMAERLYDSFRETIDGYNVTHLTIQQTTVDKNIPPDAPIATEALELAVGKHLIAQANTLLAAILEHLEKDETRYREVADQLSAELKRRFQRPWMFWRTKAVARLTEPEAPD